MKKASKKLSGKKFDYRRIIGTILFVTLLFSIGYSLVCFLRAPETPQEPHDKLKSDYGLMLLQCTGGLIVMFLPSFVERKLSLRIPNYMFVLYFVFLYCAIYLGEVWSFYYRIPFWDIILHTFSGMMLGALGFSLVSLLNSSENISVRLSPFFVAFFAFCFALACGMIWEIYEFTVDGIAGMNMQKFALETGEPMIGREALSDTMEDIIVDTVGAFVVSLLGFISLKLGRPLETIRAKKRHTDDAVDAPQDAPVPPSDDKSDE